MHIDKQAMFAPRPGRSTGLSLKFNLNQRNNGRQHNAVNLRNNFGCVSRRNNCSRNMAVYVIL